MALPENQPLSDVTVGTYLASVTDASSAFAVAPCKGTIIKMYSVIYNAITTADDVITSKINGTAITHPTWTIAFTASAAGDVDSVVPTAANVVNAGDHIEFISSGASDTACPAMFYAVIRRDI